MKYLNVGLLSVACLCGLLITCQPVKAQFVSDYFLVGGSGGYSTLVGHTSEMSVPGLANAGLHIGWEVRRVHFIYRPLVFDFQYFSSKCNTNLSITDVPIKDTRLGNAVMHYNTLTPLKETQRFFIPSIGFMFGYSGNNYSYSRIHGAFYCLAGLKLSLKVDIKNSVNLSYSTSATYERYIDDYEDMPNHYYTEHKSSETVNYGPKVMVGCMFSGELGWEFNMDHYDKFKVGAFADLGISNIMYGFDKNECAPNPENVVDVMVDSYYKSPQMDGKYIIPVMTGVKLTYLFNVNIKRNCVSRECRIGYRRKKHNR